MKSKKSSFLYKRGINLVVFAFCLTFCFSAFSESSSKLPKTEILGKEYYVYEIKKGESIYGISKKNGWDLEELLRLNPDANGQLSKGMKLYYPTGNVSVVTEMPQPIEIEFSSLEPIEHKVKKGETVYSISRQYNVPLEVIYKYNPESKKGVKAGEVIEIPQNSGAQFYYYKVKAGDTLPEMAQKFNTSVEDIIKNNAGLSPDKVKEGEVIRITLNSNVGKFKTQLVEEEHVAQIKDYKVKKNESWNDISEKTGVEVEVLKEANNEIEKPEENGSINVPIVETVSIEKEVPYETPENLTEEDVEEIYENVKGINSEDTETSIVKLALLLDEPSSKKDVDFTRGILVALNEMKESSYKIDFKVLDGRVSSTNLISELDDFEPNIIVTTADKAFPLFLADYGETNNIQIINVFDLKNDLYEDNSSIVQILPPSSYFNDRISTRLYQDYRDRKLKTIGIIDESDGIATELLSLYEDDGENISLEEFGHLSVEPGERLILYSYANRKEEVADFLKNVDNLSENYTWLDFIVVGRPSWITMIDDYQDKFEEYNVVFPSRVWLDENSVEWKKFANGYEELFGGYPVRSVPNFAASGYDIANYFIPVVANNQGDFNKGLKDNNHIGLQNDFSLTRINNWSGMVNTTGYILKPGARGKIEKIIVK